MKRFMVIFNNDIIEFSLSHCPQIKHTLKDFIKELFKSFRIGINVRF